MKKHFNIIKIPILYGGSVKAINSADIFSLKNVDGGLIGETSLIASEFCKIYDSSLIKRKRYLCLICF